MMAVDIKGPIAGEVRHEEPMSLHTSWRVGGPAETLYRPADLDDLSTFLHELPGEVPVFWFGLGSNLLVRDGGLPGVVIAAAGIFQPTPVAPSPIALIRLDSIDRSGQATYKGRPISSTPKKVET